MTNDMSDVLVTYTFKRYQNKIRYETEIKPDHNTILKIVDEYIKTVESSELPVLEFRKKYELLCPRLACLAKKY